MTTFVRELHRLLNDHPEEWVFDECVAEHEPSQTRLWTNGGWLDLNTYHSPGHVPFWQRWRLWRSVRAAQDAVGIAKIRDAKKEQP